METKTALVWSDSAVELYSVAFVNLYNAIIIDPRNAEGDDPFRLDHTFKNGESAVFFFVLFNDNFEGIQDFLDSLMEFRFTGILGNYSCVNFFCV